MFRRLKNPGAIQEDLIKVYTTQIRPTLEFAAPVWHPALTLKEEEDIERVQKATTKIILQEKYKGYSDVFKSLN